MADHLHDAADVIAKAVKATADPHAGWIKYAPAGDAAVLALVEAGWTPPGDGDEAGWLRQVIADQQAQVRQFGEHAVRKDAELFAAGAFREKFLNIKWQLQNYFVAKTDAARIADEPEPMYTAEQVMKWLDSMLDRSDKAAEKTKTKSLKAKQAEKKPATPGAPDGLFEAALPKGLSA
jgi:hypothetical protein